MDPDFAAACRKADLQQRKKRRNKRLEKLKALLDDRVSLEHAYAEIQRMAEIERLKAKPTIDPAQRRQEISAILGDVEDNFAGQRHLPEDDATEALKIIERIERKLSGKPPT